MATESGHEHAVPAWFVDPGKVDSQAWVALILMGLAIYGIFYLYARFDRWAEHSAASTPLAKTIPTMLTIALLYEVFPLGHFNILLPLAAILIALMADFTHFRFGTAFNDDPAPTEPGLPDPPDAPEPDATPKTEPTHV